MISHQFYNVTFQPAFSEWNTCLQQENLRHFMLVVKENKCPFFSNISIPFSFSFSCPSVFKFRLPSPSDSWWLTKITHRLKLGWNYVLHPVNVDGLQVFCLLSSWFNNFWKQNYIKTLTFWMWYILYLIAAEMVQKNYILEI